MVAVVELIMMVLACMNAPAAATGWLNDRILWLGWHPQVAATGSVSEVPWVLDPRDLLPIIQNFKMLNHFPNNSDVILHECVTLNCINCVHTLGSTIHVFLNPF